MLCALCELHTPIMMFTTSWWLRWLRICLQYRRPRSNPWVRKITWRRERLPTPVFWPGEFHGQRSLQGYSPWGCQESDMTEWLHFHFQRNSLVAQMVKSVPEMWETWVRSLGQEDPLDKGMATHSSILAWKIPWIEEPGRPQSMGSQRVGHSWATNTLTL